MSENNEPSDTTVVQKVKTWEAVGLDPRIENAILKMGWTTPTPVQAHAIPLVLEGASKSI